MNLLKSFLYGGADLNPPRPAQEGAGTAANVDGSRQTMPASATGLAGRSSPAGNAGATAQSRRTAELPSIPAPRMNAGRQSAAEPDRFHTYEDMTTLACAVKYQADAHLAEAKVLGRTAVLVLAERHRSCVNLGVAMTAMKAVFDHHGAGGRCLLEFPDDRVKLLKEKGLPMIQGKLAGQGLEAVAEADKKLHDLMTKKGTDTQRVTWLASAKAHTATELGFELAAFDNFANRKDSLTNQAIAEAREQAMVNSILDTTAQRTSPVIVITGRAHSSALSEALRRHEDLHVLTMATVDTGLLFRKNMPEWRKDRTGAVFNDLEMKHYQVSDALLRKPFGYQEFAAQIGIDFSRLQTGAAGEKDR